MLPGGPGDALHRGTQRRFAPEERHEETPVSQRTKMPERDVDQIAVADPERGRPADAQVAEHGRQLRRMPGGRRIDMRVRTHKHAMRGPGDRDFRLRRLASCDTLDPAQVDEAVTMAGGFELLSELLDAQGDGHVIGSQRGRG